MTRGGEVVGVLEGWRGLVDGLFEPLGPREISGLLPRGGTIIGTTRTNPFKLDGGVDKVLANLRGAGLDALVKNPAAPNWNGPYLKKNVVPVDPWGKPYQYKCCPGDHGDYDIWSFGADGAPGGDGENADVTSWTVAK